MKILVHITAVAGALMFLAGTAFADHDKNCKHLHGKVTVVSDNSITVGDKLIKVGESTRFIKDDQKVKLHNLQVGDIACVDTRGIDDLEGEAATVAVLSASDASSYRERELIREKEKIKEKTRETK